MRRADRGRGGVPVGERDSSAYEKAVGVARDIGRLVAQADRIDRSGTLPSAWSADVEPQRLAVDDVEHLGTTSSVFDRRRDRN